MLSSFRPHPNHTPFLRCTASIDLEDNVLSLTKDCGCGLDGGLKMFIEVLIAFKRCIFIVHHKLWPAACLYYGHIVDHVIFHIIT